MRTHEPCVPTCRQQIYSPYKLEIMKKKHFYISPQCEIIRAENATIICASVQPNAGNSSGTNNWGNDESHEGGSLFFGDNSNVAPAKQSGLWDNEDENDEW